jgi:hypothetical protein
MGSDTRQKKSIRNKMKDTALEESCGGRNACARATREAQDTHNTPDGRYGFTPIQTAIVRMKGRHQPETPSRLPKL